MGINTPGNTPEVDKVLLAAKERKDLAQDDIDENDLAVAIDNSQELADKAKVTLETQEQWKHLKDIIDREERDVANKDVVDDGRQKLTALRSEIDVQLNRKVVQDLESNDPTRQKTIWESLQNGPLASVITAGSRIYVQVRRFLIQWKLAPGNKEDLDALEQQVGDLFGAAALL